MNQPSPIILASGSVYRKQQLLSLGVNFEVRKPDVDESPKDNESPTQLATRLAITKAEKIKTVYSKACVIGSDQVCTFEDQIYGKPGSVVNAKKQLQTFSGNRIEFFTAMCVISSAGELRVHADQTVIKFRTLSSEEIDRYIEVDQPFYCAGSFKVESLGLSLFEFVESKDPSALMGLPLIKLSEYLRLCGHQIP